ncbi:MAG: winged helix-turn-helix domain-containing protein [Euryarchaeota archaeon]|nr:winged helix-turn-helix domain-containing protein [Euryarchaeota archaeon]
MSLNDRYDATEDKLKALTSSKVRTKVLLSLDEGAKTAGELEQVIGTRTTTILHAIKDMSKGDLVTRADQGYMLTNLGKMQAQALAGLINFIQVIEDHRDFWLTHDISGIPPALLQMIGMLSSSEVIKSDSASPLKSHEFFMTEMSNAKEVHGVSPIIVGGHSDTVAALVKNGVDVDLILTDNVLKICYEEYRDLLKELSEYDNFNLYRIGDDLKIAFTVTDTFFAMGLYKLDGVTYDLGNDLNFIGEEAIAWGKDLFEYYRCRSEMITEL